MKLQFAFYLALLSLQLLLAQGNTEIGIRNETGHNLTFIIYPASMVFNGADQYNLLANVRRPVNSYINGRSIDNYYWVLSGSQSKSFEFDKESNASSSAVGTLSYGKYRIDFWYINYFIYDEPPDYYLYLEYDAEFGVNPAFSNDIEIIQKNDNKFYYRWTQSMQNEAEVPQDRLLEYWHQVNPTAWRNKIFGDFRYDNGNVTTPNNYTIIPQDARRDCVPNVYSSYVPQNHRFQNSEVGTLTLNLTVQKNVSTPDYLNWPQYPPYPPYPQIAPTPIVIRGGATLKMAHGTSGSPRTFTLKKYINAAYSTSLYVIGTLWLEDSPNYNERAQIIFQSCNYSRIETGGRITMGINSEIFINSTHPNCPVSELKLYPNSYVESGGNNSKIYIQTGGKLIDCGAKIPRPNRWPRIYVEQGGNYVYDPPACQVVDSLERIYEGGSCLVVDSGIVELGAKCKFVFDGEDSYLQAGPTSVIKLGDSASIEFKNGAYLDADGCTFVNLNTGDVWSGLIFEDAGASTIQNCTFTGAVNYIVHRNTTSDAAVNNIIIKDNTFNAGNVSLGNVTYCLVSGNTFNGTGTSLNLLEVTNDINLQPDSWSIILAENTFTGGLYQTKVTGLAGNVTPVYVYDNNFNGGATIGFWTNNVSGSFKYNYFSEYDYTKALDLLNSSMDLYNNRYLSGDNANVYLNKSISRLAPVEDGQNRLLWYGGLNKLSTQNANCLYFATDADAFVEKGNNCFDLLNEVYYHISGSYTSCQSSEFYSTHNQWNISPQVNVLCNGNPMDNIYEPEISTCPDRPDWELSLVDQYITDMGNGMLDTLFETANYGGAGGGMSSETKLTSGNDKILYAQALLKKRVKNYGDAIVACRSIIDLYDTSKFFIAAVDELFINYQLADTISGNNTQITQLKNYLTAKIQQYQNKAAFVDKAYGYYLKTLVKLRQYSEAIAGYENIIANHPDPVVRLSATWERAAIMLLMNGHGGGKNQLAIKNEELRIKSNKRLLDKDPAHRISQKTYLRSKRSNDYEERSLFTDRQIKQIEAKISLFNPSSYKELREKMKGDLKLIAEVSKVEKKPGFRSNIPSRFVLRQNYPNPFNPATEIKYEISKGTYVTIKIYNTLGQLVTTLVNNEYKDAGRYSVKFDGTTYASGIYFYSMESKEFTETKKMILLK